MALTRTIHQLHLPPSIRPLVLRAAYSTTAPPPSSVSDTEVSHFNALASSWWDPHGSSRILHLMNPLRHTFIQRCLAQDPLTLGQKLRYLDIGCGGGIFSESAARLHNTASVTAIDASPEVISVAEKHKRKDPLLLEPGRLTYKNIPVEALPVPAKAEDGVDVLSVFEVVEHISHPSPFLQSCLAHVKPGGWLVGSTIARTWTSWLTTKLVAEDVMRVVPRGTHDWSQYINPAEMQSWARGQADVVSEDVRLMGMIYVPGVGWREVEGSEAWGNYFFGIRKRPIEK